MSQTVIVSPRFQVIIPRKVREALGIRAGHKIQVVPYGDRIELIPIRPVQELRGALKGIDTTIECEPDRV
jgi:AbrB family looped-hinge helix DNA binding protein